jgi:hypothetical protein
VTGSAFSDAWFLEAVGWSEAGVTLVELISTADYIDHAILTRDEIEGAVDRLRPAGLLRVDEGRFVLTEAGQSLRRAHERLGVLARIGRLAADPALAPPAAHATSARRWRLPEAEYRRALTKYQSGFPADDA